MDRYYGPDSENSLMSNLASVPKRNIALPCSSIPPNCITYYVWPSRHSAQNCANHATIGHTEEGPHAQASAGAKRRQSRPAAAMRPLLQATTCARPDRSPLVRSGLAARLLACFVDFLAHRCGSPGGWRVIVTSVGMRAALRYLLLDVSICVLGSREAVQH